MATSEPLHEQNLGAIPIRSLGLTITGTRLEPLVAQVESELLKAGLTELRCRFYLSTEWGVPFGTLAVAIPFYLARPDLTAFHAERHGHIEGFDQAEILRYLRHEIGHAVNYGYRLYEDEAWVKLFGSITQPYNEEYRPELFSRRHVHHLPGWYAQKHPDEDWAETFAVWLNPGRDWRREYAAWPEALRKLEWCAATMARVGSQPPLCTDTELDVDVSEVGSTLDEFYVASSFDGGEPPPGLDGALRAIFEDMGFPETESDAPRVAASDLLRRIERDLLANVFRWTGHFPERTRLLVRYLAARADELAQVYPKDRELAMALALTTLVTALAVNHVQRGTYLP